MKRVKWFLLGALLIVAPYLMAPSGGFPYFPIFGAVTVQNTTASQNFSQVVVKATNAAVGSYVTFNNGTTQKGVIVNERTAGANCTGSAVDDFCLRSISGRLYGVDGQGGGQIAIIRSGSYTATFVGCTTSPTATVVYTVIGTTSNGMASIRIAPNSCTSNSTSLTLTGAPAVLRPATINMSAASVDSAIDNTVVQTGNVAIFMDSAGTLNVLRNGSATGFTAAGTKGFSNGVVYSYPLQ